MPLDVTDVASNAPEQIAHAAKIIGRSLLRRKVFDAIYHGKKKIKTVGEISKKTGLSRKQVLNEGRKLVRGKIVEQTKKGGDTAYIKLDSFHHYKVNILGLAGNSKKLDKFPTKRNPKITTTRIKHYVNPQRAKTRKITIDDFDSFSKAHQLKPTGNLPEDLSEEDFKIGIQSILMESGVFKDWGGEKNDLYSTRLEIKGKRISTAFAFKGPGTRGKLVPKKMGKNGDQIQRLFETDASCFFVQYYREIDQSILIEMRAHAISKSVYSNIEVFYGIIDGQDSRRIYEAYKEHFKNEKKNAK